MANNNESERDISQTGQYPCVFIFDSQQKNSPDNKPETAANSEKPDEWSQIELKDRLVIWLTAGIFVVAALTAYLFLKQANIMQEQLGEMKGTGQQTDRQIILSQGQLVLAGRQTASTATIADSSKKNIEATRDSIRLDQRAWIVLHGMDGFPQLNQPWTIKAYLMNIGKTPAKNVRLSCNLEPEASETAVSFREKPYGAPMLFAPNDANNYCEMFPIQSHQVNQDTLDALTQKKSVIFLFGSVTYDDVFKKPHWFTFCRVMHSDGKAWDNCHTHPDDMGDGPYKQK